MRRFIKDEPFLFAIFVFVVAANVVCFVGMVAGCVKEGAVDVDTPVDVAVDAAAVNWAPAQGWHDLVGDVGDRQLRDKLQNCMNSAYKEWSTVNEDNRQLRQEIKELKGDDNILANEVKQGMSGWEVALIALVVAASGVGGGLFGYLLNKTRAKTNEKLVHTLIHGVQDAGQLAKQNVKRNAINNGVITMLHDRLVEMGLAKPMLKIQKKRR